VSHIVKVTTKIKDEQVIAMTCEELKLKAPVKGKHKLYSEVVEGLGVNLNGWTYPVVFNTETGEAKYDNFNGSWGSQNEFDRFSQMYGVQMTKKTMGEQGYTVESMETLQDGSIHMRIPVFA